MNHIHDSEILDRLKRVTNATEVLPTPEEQEQMQKLQEELDKSKQDALISAEYLERKRQENAFLDQVKGGALST